MKIVAVCGMGIGTSVLLKMNAEKVLAQLGIEATVTAADMSTARQLGFDANIGSDHPRAGCITTGPAGRDHFDRPLFRPRRTKPQTQRRPALALASP